MYELFFQNVAKHIHLEPAEKQLMEQKLQSKTIRKNDRVLDSGGYCKYIYFVNKGCLRVFQNHEDGSETSILFCPENWWACDIISFSQGLPATFAIEALENSEVVCISAVHLEELYTQLPKLDVSLGSYFKMASPFINAGLPSPFRVPQKYVTICSANSTQR